MANYTPPSGDAVNFTFSGSYTPPSGDDVDLLFGTTATVTVIEPPESPSRLSFSGDTGFDRTTVKWSSDISGEYRIELGGSGANTGDLLAAGACVAGKEMQNTITYNDVTTASGYSGAGQYRINIYVKSEDDLWTPYG